jgi:hypothetical protein
MASKTEIFNMALSHCGGKTVLIDTESSAEALVCRTFYDIARDNLLRRFEWPFAMKQTALGEITGTWTTDEWAYAYQYPSDCMRFIQIVDEGYVITEYPNRTQRLIRNIPYKIYWGTAGREIYTDQDEAVGRYSISITETGRFPPDFVLALSYSLAAFVAPRVVSADNYEIAQLVKEYARLSANIAAANSYNEENLPGRLKSDYETARL